jgi:hypothetical protein
LENSSSNVWPRKILFFIFNGKLTGFVIIKAKQDFKPMKINLIKHKVTFTLVYNDSKYISCHKDTVFGVENHHTEDSIRKTPIIVSAILF